MKNLPAVNVCQVSLYKTLNHNEKRGFHPLAALFAANSCCVVGGSAVLLDRLPSK